MTSKGTRVVLGGALAIALAGTAALHVASQRPPDPGPVDLPRDLLLTRLRMAYGRPFYSQHDEETLIRAFFEDRRGGFFVDVGAGHYGRDSTTFFLEERLGWRGLAIDAQQEYAADYARHRPATRFFVYFVGDRSDGERDFLVSERDPRLSSGVPAPGEAYQARRVPTITLDAFLAREGVTKVDFLSMDIERAEPAALAGFDIERWRPDLVCIELTPETTAAIQAYFERHGYARLDELAGADPINAYYTPASTRRPVRVPAGRVPTPEPVTTPAAGTATPAP